MSFGGFGDGGFGSASVDPKKEMEEMEKTWWSVEPLPEGHSRIDLTFEDASALHHGEWSETWAPEVVASYAEEPFDRAFQRFRVQANKKYRHPFKPALSFDIVRETQAPAPTKAPGRTSAPRGKSKSTPRQPSQQSGSGSSDQDRISFDDASKYTVQQVIDLFEGKTSLTYARNDYGNQAHSKGPIRLLPWERQLPAWCETPSHWIDPSTPPGFGRAGLKVGPEDAIYEWRKILTLVLPGLGGTIVPSTTTPSLIPSHVFIIARPTSAGDQCPTLQPQGPDDDRVADADKRDPASLTEQDIRAHILGRYIQTCTLPPGAGAGAADERPAKRARKAPAEQRFGVAWGYEPATRRLYCVTPLNTEFVVDLSVRASEATAGVGPDAIPRAVRPEVVRCEWIGPVSIGVDRAAGEAAAQPDEQDKFGAWFDEYDAKVKELNASETALTFEVSRLMRVLVPDS
jgi:hypothetical protein